MSWTTTLVFYRLGEGSQVTEVFSTDDFKKAKYWLSYIAEPGDILCRTPNHPKHSKNSPTPEYFGHKEQSGQASYDEAAWKKHLESKGLQPKFPEQQTPSTAS